MATKEWPCVAQDYKFDVSRFDLQKEKTVRELRIFFENILKSLCIPPVYKYSKFRRSLGDIRSLKHPDIEVHAVVDYKKVSFRLAYIFAYSLIHSVTVYDRFSDMMLHNPSMMKKIASMKDISLCVLGGGPAFEVVAVCKLLSKVLIQLGSEDREPLQLHITVIDICTEWENELTRIISFLQRELKECDNVTINFSFIEADLSEDFSPAVKKAFKKAHFIIMNKFLSDVSKDNGMEKTLAMIHNLIESMSYKSCLFLLDFSGGGAFNSTNKVIDKTPCMTRMYGPSLRKCCVLKEDTVEKFSTSLQNIFPPNLEKIPRCTVQSTISCSAWIKIRNACNTANSSVRKNDKLPGWMLRNIEAAKCKEKKPKIKIKKEIQSHQKQQDIVVSL